jgi:hypothetical protein
MPENVFQASSQHFMSPVDNPASQQRNPTATSLSGARAGSGTILAERADCSTEETGLVIVHLRKDAHAMRAWAEVKNGVTRSSAIKRARGGFHFRLQYSRFKAPVSGWRQTLARDVAMTPLI